MTRERYQAVVNMTLILFPGSQPVVIRLYSWLCAERPMCSVEDQHGVGCLQGKCFTSWQVSLPSTVSVEVTSRGTGD